MSNIVSRAGKFAKTRLFFRRPLSSIHLSPLISFPPVCILRAAAKNRRCLKTRVRFYTLLSLSPLPSFLFLRLSFLRHPNFFAFRCAALLFYFIFLPFRSLYFFYSRCAKYLSRLFEPRGWEKRCFRKYYIAARSRRHARAAICRRIKTKSSPAR